MPNLTYLQAIRLGLIEEMEHDPSVFLMGEDIAQYGGAFKLTDGLLDRFGEHRVIDTPIVEAALIGAAAGAAMIGLRPVIEMQFIDFLACGFNQLVNLVAKFNYRTGHKLSLVVRGPCGGGVGAGPFHSQNPEPYFLPAAGLKIVAPSTPAEARGLLKAAIRDDNPVLFLEYKRLYRQLKQDISLADNQVIPLGKAAVKKTGTDLTIITYGAPVHIALEASQVLMEDYGIAAEVLDLRTLVPLDEQAIFASVEKTNKAMIVHEAPAKGGPAGEMIARIVASRFEYLDGPPLRVAAKDTPVPYSLPLEKAFLPTMEEIVESAKWLARY